LLPLAQVGTESINLSNEGMDLGLELREERSIRPCDSGPAFSGILNAVTFFSQGVQFIAEALTSPRQGAQFVGVLHRYPGFWLRRNA
jgi:hypothetical protein